MNQDGRAPAALSWTRGPAGPGGRLGRAGVFAGLSSALAVGAHRLGGGSVSTCTAWAMLAAFALLGLLVAGGRERSGRFLGVLVPSSQLAAHLLLSAPMLVAMLRQHTDRLSTATLELILLCGHSRHPVSGAALHRVAHGMNVDQLERYATGGAPPQDPHTVLAAAVASATPMIAAHLAAAALMAWWLRRGERAVWAAAERVVVTVRSLVRGLSLASTIAPRGWVPAVSSSAVRTTQWSLPLSRRGPPRAVLSAPSCL